MHPCVAIKVSSLGDASVSVCRYRVDRLSNTRPHFVRDCNDEEGNDDKEKEALTCYSLPLHFHKQADD